MACAHVISILRTFSFRASLALTLGHTAVESARHVHQTRGLLLGLNEHARSQTDCKPNPRPNPVRLELRSLNFASTCGIRENATHGQHQTSCTLKLMRPYGAETRVLENRTQRLPTVLPGSPYSRKHFSPARNPEF